MKTEKHDDRFPLTWLVLSAKKQRSHMFCAKAAYRQPLHDGDVYECAETNYDSNGVFTVDLQHCVEYFSGQKNEKK